MDAEEVTCPIGAGLLLRVDIAVRRHGYAHSAHDLHTLLDGTTSYTRANTARVIDPTSTLTRLRTCKYFDTTVAIIVQLQLPQLHYRIV